MNKRAIASVLLIALFGLAARPAAAGPFADDMARCLVNSTSESDRADLVRWIYSAMSLHPDLASMAQISATEREQLTARAGALFSRLLFQSCKPQLISAVQNEGPPTIAYAFQVLGQVAMRGLMTDAHVTQEMQALGKSIDQAKLKELLAQASKGP